MRTRICECVCLSAPRRCGGRARAEKLATVVVGVVVVVVSTAAAAAAVVLAGNFVAFGCC